MTSRLKHKLELEQINLKSAYLNESFVQIGTPLPALAETRKDQLEYVPEWKQEVRDEKGRRRFHGAFTGGFSAGYYNSVGSKEGWAPSNFKSSVNNRANKVQRPEDFMDEEDLAQMNEDRQLENTETFKTDTFAGTKEELAGRGGPSTLESLIAPARSSIGQSLLTKLGWRPGQGIGPRVTLRKLKRQEGKLAKSRVGIEEADEDEEMDDVEASKHTFAPRDVRLVVYPAKEDREGLGYEKGKGMGRLPGRAAASARPDEEDDEDPYGVSHTGGDGLHFAFDTNEEDGDIVVMGGPSRQPSSIKSGTNGAGRQPLDADDRWHDGRPVLPGFVLDPLGVPTEKWFEMPEIPPDWHPRPARVWGTTRKFDDTTGIKQEEKDSLRGVPGRPLTHEQRGEALGEEQRLSKAKSVFEYISEKDQERLASIAAAAKTSAPPPLRTDSEPEQAQLPAIRSDELVIPPLSPRTASAALKGYMPFGDDLSKQDRYRSYLQSQTLHTKQPIPQLRAGQFDEINKELEDFAASARIFKPMSFAMSSRFTAGSSALAATDLKQAKPGLHIYDAEKAKAEMAKPQNTEIEDERNLTPREQAAKNGMYGKLTREIKEFYPVKLLCKRFGVADPHPEGAQPKVDHPGVTRDPFDSLPLPKNDASWQDGFIHQAGTQEEIPAPPVEEGGERVPRSIADVGMADDINQGREILTATKPNIDIFKAIFASDDEDSDSEDAPPLSNVASVAKPSTAVSRIGEDPFPVREEGPVDLATFKPVFIARREEDRSKEREKDKEKKEKRKKDKKRKGVLSFDIGEDGDEEADKEREEKKRKKREKEREKEKGSNGKEEKENRTGNENGRAEQVEVDIDAEGEGDWVEKPAVKPRLVGRMGAADFM
ncbi:hypothetical protein BCR39DRAFT_563551 [Naematelia encephala]|uniref:G-patch domain-containing protein n=1 Tax=Naematelia encephala TaxID=71784 RepID=A0A1Y2BJJ6_9TREE|nr:hypothetical protein BCR39DRAFT_563551 [Naematelia encephala]